MSAGARREDFADELRGFALLGIVTVNVPFLGLSSTGFTDASLASPLDRLAALLVVAFAQGKFYLLFAFLFGYSLSFLLASPGPATRRRFLRRLWGLALLGLAHVAVGFIGDILVLYAVLGVIPLWLWRRPQAHAVATAVGALVAWVVLLGALVALDPGSPSAGTAELAQAARWERALAEGTFVEAVRARFSLWPAAFTLIAVLNGLPVVTMFACGVLAGRVKLLADPGAFRWWWRRGLLAGAVLGLPCGLASAWLTVGPGTSVARLGTPQLVGVVLGFVGAPALTAGYVSALALLRERRANLLRVFRPAGRMSLTGYLGESFILSLVFCGYGLGLFGRVGAAVAVTLGLATWAALDLFAHFWQRRFGVGPLEALLRWWSTAPSVGRAIAPSALVWLGTTPPADPHLLGRWTFEDDGTVIDVRTCPPGADDLCATIVDLPKDADDLTSDQRMRLCGLQLMGLKPGKRARDVASRYDGWIVDPEPQSAASAWKRYSVSVTLDPADRARLEVRGPFGVVLERHRLIRASDVRPGADDSCSVP